jgi:hypothetical protein
MSENQASGPPLPDDLQRRKDAADVEKAEADVRGAEATARKTRIEADKEAAAAVRDQISALIPDLTKVKESTMEAKDGTPMWGTFLTFEALPRVADRVATILLERGKGQFGKWRLLVTSDPDLASADASYGDVMGGLDQLIHTSDKLAQDAHAEVLDPVTGGLALAAALPGLLSLLSAHRTVSTAATAANDLAAVAAVTRQLRYRAPDLAIVYDDFRLVPNATVHQKVANLGDCRLRLVERKLTLSDEKSTIDAALADAKAAKRPDAKKIADLTRQSTNIGTRLGLIDSAILAIDTVLAGIRAVPAGAKRSLLATTALQEALHLSNGFTHVLLVKAEAGQARESLDNRPLWLEDKFFAIADASITYLFIQTSDSTIVESGTVTRLASASGDTDGAPLVAVSDMPGK